MVNIILLEGIPTSGKSYVSRTLVKLLAGRKVSLSEDPEVVDLLVRRNDKSNREPVEGAPKYLRELLDHRLAQKP